tara:strand:- start:62 stop:496 length:435 start_codon:yes stop_codon:yes gene_type:complete
MNEIEKTKKEIEVLTKKLSFLEELSQTKTPCEIAYKEVYGRYPITDIRDTCWDGSTWNNFRNGYIASQKDYKVGEYQPTPEEPEELKTLYQMFYENDWNVRSCEVFCDIVKEWMSQYADNVLCGECKKGYEYCLTVLEENLKND